MIRPFIFDHIHRINFSSLIRRGFVGYLDPCDNFSKQLRWTKPTAIISKTINALYNSFGKIQYPLFESNG